MHSADLTDAAFMLTELRRGPATTNELIRRSYAERGVGLTAHSRASTLRELGHNVSCTRIGSNGRRGIFQYRLEG